MKLFMEPTLCCPDLHSNHRVTWVERDLSRSSPSNPCHEQGHLSLIQVAQGPIQSVLEQFQDGISTVLPCNLLHCLITLIVKSVFLTCNINLVTSSLKLFHLVLSLHVHVNSLFPSCRPRYWKAFVSFYVLFNFAVSLFSKLLYFYYGWQCWVELLMLTVNRNTGMFYIFSWTYIIKDSLPLFSCYFDMRNCLENFNF